MQQQSFLSIEARAHSAPTKDFGPRPTSSASTGGSLYRLFYERMPRALETFIKPFLPCSAGHCSCLERYTELKVSQEDMRMVGLQQCSLCK